MTPETLDTINALVVHGCLLVLALGLAKWLAICFEVIGD